MSRSFARVVGSALAAGLLLAPALPASAAEDSTEGAGPAAERTSAAMVVPANVSRIISDACLGTPLRYGSQGPCVAQLQSALNLFYGLGLAADGSYGPATTRAVRWFQGRYGLTVDGRCGPQTWGQLLWVAIQYDSGLAY